MRKEVSLPNGDSAVDKQARHNAVEDLDEVLLVAVMQEGAAAARQPIDAEELRLKWLVAIAPLLGAVPLTIADVSTH